MYGYMDIIWICGYVDMWMYGYMHKWVHGYMVYGYMFIRIHGYMDIEIVTSGYTDIWLECRAFEGILYQSL